MDFHSFPWLLKCHRVSWFECKVAQLAPIMLNVKTCEDSFLNQPRDRQQNTHAFSCQPHRWAGLLSVNQRPFSQSWPPARLGQNYSWKNFKYRPKRYNWVQAVKIFEAIFQIYFTTSAASVKVVLSLSGWMVLLLLLLLLTVYWQNNVINLGHAPWQLTCLPCCYFCLCVSEKLFKKAISVRIESPFVIGLPYSTVI